MEQAIGRAHRRLAPPAGSFWCLSDELQRNRELWSLVNEQFTDDDASLRWAEPTISWGLFSVPDAELGLLAEVAGLDILELGCGTAYLSAWLRRAGGRPVALDLSRAQLETARQCQSTFGAFPLIEADGAVLPVRSESFDLVVSEYGVGPWCDPQRWLPEAARVLRPGGRLVFLTSSVLLGLCVPAEGGTAQARLLRTQQDLAHISWPGGGTEHHPSHGTWIRELRANGFVVDALHELHPPARASAHEFYEIVDPEWARNWPAEELWVATKAGEPEQR